MNTLRELRRDACLSQRALADLLAVPVNTLRMWDSGLRPAPAHMLLRVRRAIACHAERTELMPMAQLAQEFHVHVRTLQAAVRTGRLTAHFSVKSVFGRPRRLATRAAVEQFIARHYRCFSGQASQAREVVMNIALVLSLAVSIAVTPLLTQTNVAKPDFTGTWTLIADKSDIGGRPAPSWVLHIKHKEPALEITGTKDGEQLDATRVEIGGKEVTVESTCCGTGTVKYRWEGQALESEFRWSNGVQKDVRTLSPDWKTMTDVRTISEGGGDDRVLKLVFGRQ